MVSNESLPDDMWAAAKLIWETTPDISYSDLIDQLRDVFGDEAPKSKSSISYRIKKDGWVKKKVLKKPSANKKTAERRRTPAERPSNDAERITGKIEKTVQKNNKVDDGPVVQACRTAEQNIEQVAERLVMSAEQRAERIITHRKRLRRLGILQDAITDIAIELSETDFDYLPPDDEEGGDSITKKLVMASELSKVLDKLTSSQKATAEMEFPICGITPEDFSQSDRDRRLDSLEALAGIQEEEEAMRDELHRKLQDRMARVEQFESDPDFFLEDDTEDVEFSEVDDD